jgi:hypothetical protein
MLFSDSVADILTEGFRSLLRESLAGPSASSENKKPGGLPPVIEESNKVAADWKRPARQS